MEDGRILDGILYPRDLAETRHKDISSYGGWREYVNALEGGHAGSGDGDDGE